MMALPESSIDLCFTSPPYYNAREYSQYSTYAEYLNFLSDVLLQCKRVVKRGRPIIFNVSCVIESRGKRSEESTRHAIPFDLYGIAKLCGLDLLEDIIWQKPDGASNRAIKFAHHRRPVAYKPFQVTEYILVFRERGGLIDNIIRQHPAKIIEQSLVEDGYERTNVWYISPERNKNHPAPYPLVLAEKVIKYYSYVGDVVLDPFMGSGTTAIAAINTNRKYIGFELDKEYYEKSLQRIAGHQKSIV